MDLINNIYKIYKKPLKKAMVGFEVEYQMIDREGKMRNRAPEVIKKVLEKHPKTRILPECGKNFFELNSFPSVSPYNPALDLIKYIENVQDVMEKMDLMVYPFATYPNKYKVEFSDSGHYGLKNKIFGDKFKLATNNAAFHAHYTLPKGVFDEKTKNIKLMTKSKMSRSLVNSYNFCIAADPVMTLFAQSSPFHWGKTFSKDMRVLNYRGGKKLKYEEGMYTKMQMLGNLPPYKMTMTDIVDLVNKRWNRWDKLAKKVNPKIDISKIYASPLDISWNPVKINKVGTIEQRSMDTNFMTTTFAIAVLFKFCMKKIQDEFIEVIPADFAIDEPFKLENNILYIPPHSYLRNKMQFWSITEGFENKEVLKYARRLFMFARTHTSSKYKNALKPLYDMIDEKKSMSDRILSYAKRKGFMNGNKISKAGGEEMALYFSKKFPKDLELAKKAIEKIANM